MIPNNSDIDDSTMLEIQENLSAMFRIALEGIDEVTEEKPFADIKDHCERFLDLLNDDFFVLVEQICPSDSTSETERHQQRDIGKAIFFLELWEHLFFLRMFKGLDLGSALQSVLHTRLVAQLLRRTFHHVHSVIVLRNNANDNADEKYIYPLLEHSQNAPCFPSGAWVRALGWSSAGRRLAPHTVAIAIEDYSRRLCDADTTPEELYDCFKTALSSFVDAEDAVTRLSENDSEQLRVQFGNIALLITQPWRNKQKIPAKEDSTSALDPVVEDLLEKIWRLAEKNSSKYHAIRVPFTAECLEWFEKNHKDALETLCPNKTLEDNLTEVAPRLFYLQVFERALFAKLSKDLEKLVERSRHKEFKHEKRHSTKLFDSSRIIFQKLKSASESDFNMFLGGAENSSAAIWQNLASWVCRKVINNGDRTAGDKELVLREDGLRWIGSACLALEHGTPASIRAALTSFRAVLNDAPEQSDYFSRADTPFLRDSEAGPLIDAYWPGLKSSLDAGLSVAVHSSGPAKQLGSQQPDIECYRIDILADLPEKTWDVEKTHHAIQQSLRMDPLFVHAEMLAADTERRWQRDEDADRFRSTIRSFTSGSAHELRYTLSPLVDVDLAIHIFETQVHAARKRFKVEPTDIPYRRRYIPGTREEAIAIIAAFSHVGKLLFPQFSPSNSGSGISPFVAAVLDRDEYWMKATYAELRTQADAIITTMLCVANGHPEKPSAPTNVRQLIEHALGIRAERDEATGLKEVFKNAFQSDLDGSLLQEHRLPSVSIELMIIQELIRNALKYCDNEVVFKACIDLPTGTSDLRITVHNDISQPRLAKNRGHGAGQEFIRDVLRANLDRDFKEDVEDLFWIKKTPSTYDANIRIPLGEYCKFADSFYAKNNQ